ncbi:DUF3108 domain-containing protein [Chitinophagales bacterium]|nr:DUF3108 domain-containing protein [Chitinophagales bacterium]
MKEIEKNRRGSLVVLMLLLAVQLVHAQISAEMVCSEYQTAHQVGERLEYKAYYHWGAIWIGMGRAEIQLQETELNGKQVLHAVGIGKTLPRYNWIFKVNDRYESYFLDEPMRPLRFVRNVKEGGYSKELQYSFDQDNQSFEVDYWFTQGKEQNVGVLPGLKPCTQDIISAFYQLRSLNSIDWFMGDTIPLNLVIDAEIYEVGLVYHGKEEIKTEFGKRECLKIEPILLAGDLFTEGDKMLVWVSNDANKLPLVVKSDLAVGEITMYLEVAQGTIESLH